MFEKIESEPASKVDDSTFRTAGSIQEIIA